MWSNFVDAVANINSSINSVVWGVPMLVLIVGTGILMTVLTKFFQLTHFGHTMRETFLAIFRKKSVIRTKDKKSISQFQALATALAATIGTGNIAGVATAIAVGGPGAVFWMWISAFFGMMTNYSENVLGIYYRRRNSKGEWSGGAMYYLEQGVGKKKVIGVLGKPLAIIFSIFCTLASFGIGNMTQVNTISEAMTANFAVPSWITGLVLAAIAALVIVGGIKRIAQVTEKLVPFMALFYIVGALIIFVLNFRQIPYVFKSIFTDAFNFSAIAGGVGGVVIKRAITMGFKRGVFSNEAGLGSSVMVHSASDVKEPAVQGLWGIFEVFFDTIIVCTLTAFVLLSSTLGTVDKLENINISSEPQYVSLAEEVNGVLPLIDARYNQTYVSGADGETGLNVTLDGAPYTLNVKTASGEGDFIYTNVMQVVGVDADKDGNIDSAKFTEVSGVSLVTYAFSRQFGHVAGKLLTVAVLLFAFSTVLGWSFYGTKSTEYLLGEKPAIIYKVLFVAFIFLGTQMGQNLAWDIADTLNGLMALPNLIGVLLLSGVVVRITRDYVGRKITGKLKGATPVLSAYPDIQKAHEEAIRRGE